MANFLRSKRLFVILAAVALLIAGGAWYYYSQVVPAEASSTSSAEAVKTARVRRGNLVISASGTGALVPGDEVDLGFRAGGVLAEVPVEAGTRVEAGDLLARLDTAALERAVTQAEIALRQAEIRLETAQEPPNEADIQRAQDAVDQAAAALSLAQIDYEAAQSNVAVNEALEDARLAYQEALNGYNYWLAEYNAGEADYWWVDEAKQTLDEAQLALSRAQQQADQIVQSARNNLARATDLYNQAQNDLDQLLAGPDADDIESLELDLQIAQLNLTAVQENLANATLTAPFAGIVVAVEGGVGETVGTTPIVTLADLDHPFVKLYIDEADLDKIAPECEVEVIFDALPDEIWSGHVVVVEPELILIDGVPTIQALAILDGENTGKARFLPSGLNASVEVIGGKAEDALLVPVEALKELGPGSYSVFVVVDGQLKPRPVQVGLMDISYAEITGGLEQGELVSTGAVETE
jgi:HlyD family secretion protein